MPDGAIYKADFHEHSRTFMDKEGKESDMHEKDMKKHNTEAAGENTGQVNGGQTNAAQSDSGQASTGCKEKQAEKTPGVETAEAQSSKAAEKPRDELEALKAQLEDKSKKHDEVLNMLQRTAAEYENFRKRTAKEKEALYKEAVGDVVAAFLPVIDNIERAVQACFDQGGEKSIREGVELIRKQVDEVMKKIGVEAIKSVGEEFNPEVHNAVMHIEDESCGKNVVMEEFQKGYIYKDRVIRYSMVKVAN